MLKKTALIMIGFILLDNNCFGMQQPPKKKNQNIFNTTLMQLWKLILWPNKQKQLPPPTLVSFNPNPFGEYKPKEFVCKEIIETTDQPLQQIAKNDDQIEREIKEELDREYKRLITEKYSKKHK